MEKLSITEENYLKSILQITGNNNDFAGTNAIGQKLNTTAASVTDMLKRLSEKGFLNYTPYKGAILTSKGRKLSTYLVRKHRLWEVFLVEILKFEWGEVHDIAEQLEHIKSEKLIDKLSDFLGNPDFDPHGDPIPNEHGEIPYLEKIILADLPQSQKGIVVGVKSDDKDFLNLLDQHKITLGTVVQVIKIFPFDQSMKLKLEENHQIELSLIVTKNIYVKQN